MSQVLDLVWARSRTQADDHFFCSRAGRLEAEQASQGRDKEGRDNFFGKSVLLRKLRHSIWPAPISTLWGNCSNRICSQGEVCIAIYSHGTGRDGDGDGTGRDGTGQDGTGQDGTGRAGPGQDGTGRDGTGRDGTGWDGTGGRDGTGWDGDGTGTGRGRDGTRQAMSELKET